MEWTKVTSGTMPETEILAISMICGPCYKEYLVGWVHESEDSKTGYVCESENEILYDVTHWMKKPEPPAEE